MSEELKPCPFCGSHATVRFGVNLSWVECVNEECGAETHHGHSVKAAANIWNRRAQPAKPQEQHEEQVSKTGELPAEQQGEPVAVMFRTGEILSKKDCGSVFDTCCKVETPLYRRPAAQAVDEDAERAAYDAHRQQTAYARPFNKYELQGWLARAKLDARAAQAVKMPDYRQGLIDAQRECDRIAGDHAGRTDRERKGAGECSAAIRAKLNGIEP